MAVRRTRGLRDSSGSLTLFGVTFSEPAGHGTAVSGTELVVVRELAAIVGPGKYTSIDPTPEDATALGDIVAAYAKRAAVLPAPVGVTFRSKQAVQRWLASVEQELRRDGIDYLRLITGEPIEAPLRRFLVGRRGGA